MQNSQQLATFAITRTFNNCSLDLAGPCHCATFLPEPSAGPAQRLGLPLLGSIHSDHDYFSAMACSQNFSSRNMVLGRLMA